MTPQQLRNSILQLAMEGKLVEQRLEEGTGEELYQLIDASIMEEPPISVREGGLIKDGYNERSFLKLRKLKYHLRYLRHGNGLN